MASSSSIGDQVSWNTSQGRTQGKVVERKTKDFTFAGQQFKASEDRPKLVVQSEKSGDEAGHGASALRKLQG